MHHAPLPHDPTSWTFFFYISWHYPLHEQGATADWNNAMRLMQVQHMASGFTEPWRSAFRWLPRDHGAVWYMGFGEWDPGEPEHRWLNRGGRVTLAGDAAHTMTYQRGQGLNHSMWDAARLVQAIRAARAAAAGGREGGMARAKAEAVGAYEVEMVARAGQEVRQSTSNTVMVHDWDRVLQSPVLTKGLKKDEEGTDEGRRE
jgi:2-polyprenyl-6-methoxyphenol hydroxylase-like FAD-dependent oxidoreductase